MEIHWCIFLAIRCCPIIGVPMVRSCSLMTLAVMPSLLHFTDSYVSWFGHPRTPRADGQNTHLLGVFAMVYSTHCLVPCPNVAPTSCSDAVPNLPWYDWSCVLSSFVVLRGVVASWLQLEYGGLLWFSQNLAIFYSIFDFEFQCSTFEFQCSIDGCFCVDVWCSRPFVASWLQVE